MNVTGIAAAVEEQQRATYGLRCLYPNKLASITNFSCWTRIKYLLCIVVSFFFCATQAQAQDVQLKLTHGYDTSSLVDRTITRFTETLNNELAGSVNINVFPGGILAPIQEQELALRAGMAEIGVIPINSLKKTVPTLGLYDMFFLFPNLETVDAFQTTVESSQITAEIEKRDLKILGYLHKGMIQFASKDPVKSIESLKGRKIRVTGQNNITEQFRQMGVTPIAAPFNEVYSALQTGNYDTVTTLTEGIRTAKINEVAPSLLASNLAYDGDVLAVSRKLWDELDSDARKTVELVANDAIRFHNTQVIEQELSSQKAMGFQTLTYAEYKDFQSQATKGWQVVSGRSNFNSKWIATAVAMGDAYYQTATIDPGNDDLVDGLYWNAWIQDDDNAVQNQNIESNQVYSFVLDLSRFNLAKLSAESISSASTGETFRKHIDDALANASRDVNIRIHAMMTGSVALVEGNRNQIMKIRLDRLREPVSSRIPAKNDRDDIRSWMSNGRIGTIRGGQNESPFKLEIQTLDPGCATIALSIWNVKNHKPLDHIVFRFQVGKAGADENNCGLDTNELSIKSGLDTLLRTTSLAPTALDDFDAALHIFEEPTPGRQVTSAYAVLAVGNKNSGSEPQYYSWMLTDPPSRSMSGNAFLTAITKAQSAAKVTERAPAAFANVAYTLKDLLFPTGADASGDLGAKAAFKALKSTVQNTESVSRIYARLISSEGEIMYLPLGLLGAGGKAGPIGKQISVVQPLPRERYLSDSSCVSPWALGLPSVLMNDVQLKDDVEKHVKPYHSEGYLHDHDTFASYLNSENQSTSASEGLLLVAHQSNGEIWFDNKQREKAFLSGQLKRRFKPGSVALLAACAAAGLDSNNRLVIEQLNSMDVDTVVATPFQVDLTYGIYLGYELAVTITDFYKNPRAPAPTIFDIFTEASTQAAIRLANTVVKDEGTGAETWPPSELMDMAYQFHFLGDHGVRLCAPGEGE